jgi:putative polyhydroxyalkanoate system protein
MADLHIVRDHTLGLAKARKLAFKWAEQVEADFALQCNYSEGKLEDEVDFVRSGIKGRLLVTKDRFDLQAQLDFFLGAFKASIEAEIVKNLDALLADSPATDKPVAKKRPAKKA